MSYPAISTLLEKSENLFFEGIALSPLIPLVDTEKDPKVSTIPPAAYTFEPAYDALKVEQLTPPASVAQLRPKSVSVSGIKSLPSDIAIPQTEASNPSALSGNNAQTYMTRSRTKPKSNPTEDDTALLTTSIKVKQGQRKQTVQPYTPAEKALRLKRWAEQRKKRWSTTREKMFVRKAFADIRPRVGGRFTKMDAEERAQYQQQKSSVICHKSLYKS